MKTQSPNKDPFSEYTSEYEAWFRENTTLFESELQAIRKLMPEGAKAVEIGVGGGIFAEKLGIAYGIDPSENMLGYARKRGIKVRLGYAENLPYPDESFDLAAFITSLCFINKPFKAIQEAARILRKNACLLVAMIDRESALGHILTKNKERDKFFKYAHLYSVPEVVGFLTGNDFEIFEMAQTLFNVESKRVEQPVKGYGKGSFVVIKARKLSQATKTIEKQMRMRK